MSKQQIYAQINTFNKKPSDPTDTGSKSFEKKYLYVSQEDAQLYATFFGYIKNKFSIPDHPIVLDLAFGSGNLTSHLLLENALAYEKVYLNDLLKNNVNQNIQLQNKKILESDFFNHSTEEFLACANGIDILVFNPQIGGSSSVGAVAFESISPVNFNGEILDYLSSLDKNITDLSVRVNEESRQLIIESSSRTQTDIKQVLSGIKIFNYYDVYYQSTAGEESTHNLVGESTNIVRIRQTIDQLIKDTSIICFLGNEKLFQTLFADFARVFRLLSGKTTDFFITLKGERTLMECYEKEGESLFELNSECKKKIQVQKFNENIQELEELLSEATTNVSHLNESIFSGTKANEPKSSEATVSVSEEFHFFTKQSGKLDFQFKNILFKGVPGTGKSRTINNIMKNELGLELHDKKILRINIHSASTNADLMQGIGISTNKQNQVEYKEKQGLILKQIKDAIQNPFQPYVIVLEEIQENSLNELIGDLIYLIEPSKRTKVEEIIITFLAEGKDIKYETYQLAIDTLINNGSSDYVTIPFLVSTGTDYRKMILPNNLFIFCTSNYRDDKKIIEDNLLRRFEVIEIYPKANLAGTEAKSIQDADKSKLQTFFKNLNTQIEKHFSGKEIHPDRFLIGHAIWLHVGNKSEFCRSLLKVVTEFKDIKEIEFKDDFEKIFNKIISDEVPFLSGEEVKLLKSCMSYREIIDLLQSRSYSGYTFLEELSTTPPVTIVDNATE